MNRPHVQLGYEEAMRAHAAAPKPHVQPGFEESMRQDAYGAPVGPEQLSGFGGYAQNPLEEEGRRRIAHQFGQAPLGGYARDFAAGMGLRNDHAILAERGLAGLTAVGVGVPAFLAAVQQLTTPQDQNTIPL